MKQGERDEIAAATNFGIAQGVKIVSVVIALAIVVAVFFAWLRPKVNDLDTKGVEHSYTYVQTKKELLVKLVQDYERLNSEEALHKTEPDVVAALEAQKKATADRIRSEASSLSPDEVPIEARRFLQP